MREGIFAQEDSHSGHSCSPFCPVDQPWTEGRKEVGQNYVPIKLYLEAVYGLIGCSPWPGSRAVTDPRLLPLESGSSLLRLDRPVEST